MTLLLLSFVAGILTVAAPCVLPLLPVIVGGSVVNTKEPGKQRRHIKPLIIAASLVVSIVIFTLLLKVSSLVFGVSDSVWQAISGTIVILLGLSLLFPEAWEKVPGVRALSVASNKLLNKSKQRNNYSGDVLIGLSLGPVFNSCSPTYALVVAGILPESFGYGLVYLTAYAIGLAGSLLIIALAGQAVVSKFVWLANPRGTFRRLIAVLFLIVGVSVLFGFDKKAQSYILDRGWYNPISSFENKLAN